MAKRKPVHITTTVGEAVSTAYNTLEELASEMREAFDNTPEGLQQSAVGEARGTAADALESISEPDMPDSLYHLPVVLVCRNHACWVRVEFDCRPEHLPHQILRWHEKLERFLRRYEAQAHRQLRT